MKFLVVDDSVTMRKIVALVLRAEKYDVVEAENGKDALEKLKTDHFNCFIVDYNMPEMNGIAFIKALRQMPEYQKTPIIMLTTESEQDKQEEGRQAGANRWIVKPFKNEVLQATIRELIG
ncbi:Chemotaxis regulator - transmits chemoreceptor signals to flagellar motor components CheY [Brevinematales bacterium NS]|nr:response regulator [Brevinematales bacterium]QJR21010.1 Chemotaxis regulator - transmits chemoreceptor signals to flagellar motor components CheY [Brevinematales bacterium NS]